ncbi:MAG: cytochrome c [Gammaproteobacteria bacterium]
MAEYHADIRARRRPFMMRCLRVLALAAGMAGLWQPAMAADPLQGRKIYKTHCENCHGASGVGQIPGAPDFLRGDTLMKPDIELMRTLKSGRGMMPAYQGMFTEPELLDVIAYLRTLRLNR